MQALAHRRLAGRTGIGWRHDRESIRNYTFVLVFAMSVTWVAPRQESKSALPFGENQEAAGVC
jgi:hypothetical protein